MVSEILGSKLIKCAATTTTTTQNILPGPDRRDMWLRLPREIAGSDSAGERLGVGGGGGGGGGRLWTEGGAAGRFS